MNFSWGRWWGFQGRTGRINLAYVVVLVVSPCLLMAAHFAILRATPRPSNSKTCDLQHEGLIGIHNSQRTQLYEKMAIDLEIRGPLFVGGGETSQSLMLSDLFTVKDGTVIPLHKKADPPVRAIVLYLDNNTALQISMTVKKVLSPHFHKEGIWYQDPRLYHFSMYHASNHENPVPATRKEVDAEAAAVKGVAGRCCPLEIELQRVVLTPTGVLLGCWQVVNGTDPATIREELRKALPHSPAKQFYDPVVLYTSFARLLDLPVISPPQANRTEMAMAVFKRLVLQLNNDLCSKATIRELWYVEELDILALALKGRMRLHRFPLQCSQNA